MIRRFLRIAIFERFPATCGACAGLAQALLVGWGVVLVAGPEALRFEALAALATGLAALQAWVVHRLARSAGRRPATRALGRVYLGFALSTVVLAAALAGCSALLLGVAPLLAAAGLGPEQGAAWLRAGSAAVVSATAAGLAWGFWIEPRRLELTRLRIEVRGLDPRLGGLRVLHLTDLHIGNGIEGERLERLVARTNGAGADLIAITGDLFDGDPSHLEDAARALGGLRAPLGVFAVLGNHDAWIGHEAITESLAKHAPVIRVLDAERVTLAAPAPLHVAGVHDPGWDWTGNGGGHPGIQALAESDPDDGPTLLLVHRPDAFVEAAALGFALVLAGHFHGGQLAVPGAAGRWNVASLLSPYHRGLHRKGASVLYVSRGVGFAGPRIRLASPPELALLELEPATAA